jgi:hypothetical protein
MKKIFWTFLIFLIVSISSCTSSMAENNKSFDIQKDTNFIASSETISVVQDTVVKAIKVSKYPKRESKEMSDLKNLERQKKIDKRLYELQQQNALIDSLLETKKDTLKK